MALICTTLCAPSALAQSLSDLDRVTRATWHLAVTPLADLEAFGDEIHHHYPRATVTDQTPQTLAGWEEVATHWRVDLMQFSLHDRIDCLTLTAEGVARLRGTDVGSAPGALAPFQAQGFQADQHGVVRELRLCTGTLHPPSDFADYPTWIAWLGQMEGTFAPSRLVPVQSAASGADGYVAGHLSRTGSACGAGVCVAFATPYAVNLPDAGIAQTSITVGAVAPER
ncbi:MAG: hypothetical protein AAFY90_12175 [Pseudomonadota bacterium]